MSDQPKKKRKKVVLKLLPEKIRAKYRGKKVDLNADADRPAKKAGKRISAEGNVYYENRPNRSDIQKGKYPKLEHGGGIDNENLEMVKNQNKAIKHHTEELRKIVSRRKHVPAWVVAKIERAETDISDATHYLDGEEEYKHGGYMAKGGGVGDNRIETINIADEYNVPAEVVEKWVGEGNDISSFGNAYYGKYDSEEDFAEHIVDDLGIESISNPEYYLYMTNTDRRLTAQDMADSYVDDIRDEDGGERLISEADMDTEEFEEADEDRKEKMLDEAREIVYDRIYDEWYNGLDDPYEWFVNVQGMYSAEDLLKSNIVLIDYEKLGRDLSYDYTTIDYDGDVYYFNSSYARGGYMAKGGNIDHGSGVGEDVNDNFKSIKNKKYLIQDRVAGNVIDNGMTMTEALSRLSEYEETDKKEGCYTANFYEIKEEVPTETGILYTIPEAKTGITYTVSTKTGIRKIIGTKEECEEYIKKSGRKDLVIVKESILNREHGGYMAKGGGVGRKTFAQKVKAVEKTLVNKKVKPKYKRKYGKTYDKSEAHEAATNIIGKQKAKYDATH